MSKSESRTPGDEVFDWGDVYKRLENARQALARLDRTDSEAMQQVLARRAARLAASPPQQEEGKQTHMAVVHVGRELYGMELNAILEIRTMERVTRIPRVPAWIVGVTNLRGRILPVIDLRRFLDLPDADEDVPSSHHPRHLMIVRAQDAECALVVHDILSIQSVLLRGIREADQEVRSLPPRFVRGVMDYRQGAQTATVIILDLPTLLVDESLTIHEELV